MRKWLCALLICIVLSGCSSTRKDVGKVEPAPNNASMFVEIERAYSWCVVYHRDTKVMYAVSDGSYNYGSFTQLVNADGTPMLYSAE